MKYMVIGYLVLASGCAEQSLQDSQTDNGRALFAQHCAACHGTGGRGDGALAPQLPVAPADLTLLSRSAGGQFPRDSVMTQIYGYPGRFHRGLMPEFGPVLEGPMVDYERADGTTVQTPKALVAIARHLENIQR